MRLSLICLIIFSILLIGSIIDRTNGISETSETSEGHLLTVLVWISISNIRNETLHRELRERMDEMQNPLYPQNPSQSEYDNPC